MMETTNPMELIWVCLSSCRGHLRGESALLFGKALHEGWYTSTVMF